jgi:NCS2 family nucleobase:cation symporter-2
LFSFVSLKSDCLQKGFYIGTGLLSVVGPNFASIPAASAVIRNMYANGYCPTAVLEGGTIQNLPCPNAWGAILGTCKMIQND